MAGRVMAHVIIFSPRGNDEIGDTVELIKNCTGNL